MHFGPMGACKLVGGVIISNAALAHVGDPIGPRPPHMPVGWFGPPITPFMRTEMGATHGTVVVQLYGLGALAPNS
jgi:hypothetical protein